jgi:hypothetical protein
MADLIIDVERVSLEWDVRRYVDATEWDECTALFLIVRIRKLLEYIDPTKKRFLDLRICCDWALHIRLDRSPTGRIMDIFNQDTQVGNEEQKIVDSKLNQVLRFEPFRRDLAEFLEESGLPDDLASQDERWHDFLRGYGHSFMACAYAISRSRRRGKPRTNISRRLVSSSIRRTAQTRRSVYIGGSRPNSKSLFNACTFFLSFRRKRSRRT